MAVKTYLQTAITQVQSAMADMQSQVHGMHTNADGTKKQLLHECTNLEHERSMHQNSVGRLSDDSQRHALEDRIARINRQIDENKARMAKVDAEVAATKQRKDQLYKDLYNATGELTRLMSLPDIG